MPILLRQDQCTDTGAALLDIPPRVANRVAGRVAREASRVGILALT
jgi:hypothetical protein